MHVMLGPFTAKLYVYDMALLLLLSEVLPLPHAANPNESKAITSTNCMLSRYPYGSPFHCPSVIGW